jgi:CheY-like chemotaxis protein
MMGGRIWVESEAGQGSKFHFTARLGVAAVPSTRFGDQTGLAGVPAAATRRSPGDGRPGLRILVAEDTPVNQALIVRLLVKQGHTAVVTGTGREALAVLEKEAFDLVLMDVQMPEMDGFEAAMAIRRREQGTDAHQPIIAITAYAMKGDQERCLAAGMDSYVSKPISPAELFEAIDALMAARPGTESRR